MKSKRLTVILSVMLVIGIGLSIYQHNTTLELKNRLSVLANTKNELTKEIESNTEELKRVTSEIEKAKKTNAELTVKRDNLAEKNKELRSKVEALKEESNSDSALNEEVNSTHTDIELGEDEYQGDDDTTAQSEIDKLISEYGLTEEDLEIIDQLEQEVMAEHPEWFTDTAGNSNNNNTGTGTGNYEHVGTPSTGQVVDPDYEFGQSHSDVAPGTVY